MTATEELADTLAAQLTVIEEQPRYATDLDERLAQTRRIDAAALRIGRVDLQLRAQLLQADILGRRGDIAQSGRILRRANDWAADHGHRHLLTLSHLRLSPFFSQLGDFPAGLEHAVFAMKSAYAMGDQAPTHLRFRCAMALADALADSGDIAGARLRYAEAERLSATLDDRRTRILVFNNLAYTEHQAGDGDAARRAVDRILRLAVEHELSLDYNTLDTVASVQLAAGRYAEAAATLQPALDDEYAKMHEEVSSRAWCLLTLTQVHRVLSDLDVAQHTLDRCRLLCEQRHLSGIAVEVQREQAEIWESAGRFAEALNVYKAFHAAAMDLNSGERDARAKTLQAMYEVDEARLVVARAEELSVRDPLTGLYNRRYLDAELTVLLRRAQEAREPLSVALVDLDYFKRINDTCSHETGDQVLRALAELLTAAVETKRGPFVARLGGEEFVLVLPGTDDDAAYALAEQLREAIRGRDWRPVTGNLPVTASIGVATTPDGRRTQQTLLQEADTHLYMAKAAGRDRTVDQKRQPSTQRVWPPEMVGFVSSAASCE